MELVGDIGGLQQALMTIGLMMVSFFSRRLFLSELMHEIYQTKFNRGTTPKVEKNYKNELTGNNKSMKSK